MNEAERAIPEPGRIGGGPGGRAISSSESASDSSESGGGPVGISISSSSSSCSSSDSSDSVKPISPQSLF
jgi:hypothetical protein